MSRRQLQTEKKEDSRLWSEGIKGEEDGFLGGSDPSLSGLAAAQRHRRRGSLPPKFIQQNCSLRRSQSCSRTAQQD